MNAASVLGPLTLYKQRIWNRTGIKPFTEICNGNGHSLSRFTMTLNMDKFLGIHPVTVNDCIAQSFVKGQFYLGLIAGNTMRSLN